ncbi:hypothetical protein GCM10011572_51830 [Pseudoduganella buxea]|uniref:Uncharacterized protein n=1 Tax=Pseudoduganella buxea TaxID=1949069 RepID=A0ABQ1LGS9_9BURK|nr:hypothetical protein GCM10011572_51830 [Pseudoduganella buxea]
MGAIAEVVVQFRNVMLRDLDMTLELARERDRRSLTFAAESEGERAARESLKEKCDRAEKVLNRHDYRRHS